MTPRVEQLGFALVKGLSWTLADTVQVTHDGVVGDRHWSPVTPDLRCIKATDFPEMVGLSASAVDLPTEGDALFDGESQTVRYYSRPVRARVFGGRLADRISEAAGQRLYLAQAPGPGSFLWSSPVSVLLRSELDGLPGDVGRYRANVVVDDRADLLRLAPGAQLSLGDVLLEVERELERCVIVNHDLVTGSQDASLLGDLRPGVLLGYGCRVLQSGRVSVGDAVERRSPRAHRSRAGTSN
ncbi:MOSC domain-containing protein [Kocuria sp. JC486]|uniref:MOSC domain-containing protein n=1 Tax=Kocuria sp. JC486 TaxID=1970736 RepID=UPI001423C45A|nr:MOSC domain-containing protein [Kocuria sp. JC486]NHU84854.1 MOSC domain-containing protein [Kocuria sp. JC486]